MKETQCPLCKGKVSIADQTTYKQHVRCPYCNGKFSYLVDSEEFSIERLAYAVEFLQKNSAESRYYNQAPEGARMYIGLLFYAKVFKHEVDPILYLAAIRKVEPKLSKKDWQYLLENEDGPELATYYRDRMNMAKTGLSAATTLRAEDYFKPDNRTVQAVAVTRETLPATCPLCGEKLSVSANAEDGQHVLCPFCDRKFVFYKDCFDSDGELINGERAGAAAKPAKQPTGKTQKRESGKKQARFSVRDALAKIKSRYDLKLKKRAQRRAILARLGVLCIFTVSVLCSAAAYYWWQKENEDREEARRAAAQALSQYLTDTSVVLSDYHSKYAIAVHRWKNERVKNNADAEKVRAWLDKVAIIQSDIRRMLYDFNQCGRQINSPSRSIQDFEFFKSDFEFRKNQLFDRIRKERFDPPVVVDAPKKQAETVPQTKSPPKSPPRIDTANQLSSPGGANSGANAVSISNRNPPTIQETTQAKVDRMIEKLKEKHYSFDPEAIRKYDLPTQVIILEEMLDDVEMSEKRVR